MAKQMIENITVDHLNIASVLMGYNINTGWRSQPNISISVPYKAWLTFTKMYKHLRPFVNELTLKEYYKELAIVQYNEVLQSINNGTEGTLILPLNDNAQSYIFDEYNRQFESANILTSQQFIDTLRARVECYYKLIDSDIFVPTLVNPKKISEWNKKLLIQSISYLLLDEKLYSIERR